MVPKRPGDQVPTPESPVPGPGPQARISPLDTILADIHEHGPITVARFMEFALYDPEFGYYTRAAQRSGRAGDFFTSVDVGPLFGELLAIQFAEMFDLLGAQHQSPLPTRQFPAPPVPSPQTPIPVLVEAAAGNGRLSADILRAWSSHRPDLVQRVSLHLVETSAPARSAQAETLGERAHVLKASTAGLPASFDGVLFANELLDAMPVHQVVMRADGLHEIHVARAGPSGPELRAIEAPPSTPALAAYLRAAGVTLDVGQRAEISLAAIDWTRRAARALGRGFFVLIDYGHEARELYSASHADGTLTSFRRHTMRGGEQAQPGWLEHPGDQDVTAHVDFTSVRAAAEAEGCTALGLVDQTYFLMALVDPARFDDDKRRRALKTLIMPGGLGSTMKVLVLAKNIGAPRLKGLAHGRLT